MRMTTLDLRRAALGSVSVLGMALAFASPAFAQASTSADASAQPACDPNDPNDPDCDTAANEQTGAGQESIVVTGSRIPRPEFSGNIPGVQVDQEQISTRGFTNAIEVINDVPLVGAGADLQGNNGAGQPSALGQGFVDLLDLGTARTLVLVNGRRFVGGNAATLFSFANETGSQVDVNSIPTPLIQRVDVVTVGGAAAYGTDAIAGVVNFILRDEYEGTDLSAIYNISDRGDATGYNLRALHGLTFADGRGNVVISGEYSHIESVDGSQREFLQVNDLFASSPFNGAVRNPAFQPIVGNTNPVFLSNATDGRPASIALFGATSLIFGPGGAVFDAANGLPAQNRVAPFQTSAELAANAQIIPGIPVAATAAGCDVTNLTTFCFFAPNALPAGTTAQQDAFASAVIAQFAPGQAGVGTTAQRRTLALQLLQANRQTPREFFAANPNVNINNFLGSFATAFPDVANTTVGTVTVGGIGAVPISTVFPRLAVPVAFDANGNAFIRNAGAPSPTQAAVVGGVPNADGEYVPQSTLLRPQQDRYLANLIGHFDLTDNITFFTENLYARVKAVTPFALAQTNANTTTSTESRPLILNVNNPFLDDADRAVLAQAGITAAVRNGNFIFNRRNTDIVGNNPSRNESEVFRFVNGFRGDFGAFGRDFTWELSGTYGQSTLRTEGRSIKDVEYALAVDAVRDASGTIRCRAQIDPTAATNLPGVQANIIRDVGPDGIQRERIFTPTATADQIAACVPLNPFGQLNNQAVVNYLRADTLLTNRSKQMFFQGLLTGPIVDLPAGELQFAVSGEYRREELGIRADELGAFGRSRTAPTSPTQGTLTTTEGGLEFRIPILGEGFNLPLFYSVEFNPSMRLTRQTGSSNQYRDLAGNLIEPKFEGDWEFIYSLAGTWRPIRDLQIRGNYTRSLRQPGVVELFLTNQSAFAATTDPCTASQINASTDPVRRRTNCLALVNQFVPAATLAAAGGADSFLNTFVANGISQPVAFAGNPGLRPEKGESYTYGAIFTPRFIPGLSLSADYVNVLLKDLILPTNPTNAAFFCVDSPSFPDTTSEFGQNLCPFVPRSADFQIAPGARGAYLNLTATQVEGINISGAYNFSLGNLGRIELRANAFHLLAYDTSSIGDFSDRQRSAGTFSRPRWETVSSVRWEREEFYAQVTHRFRTNGAVFSGGVPVTIESQQFFIYPELHSFDLAAGWNLDSGYRIQFAVTNLTDNTTAGILGRLNGTYFDSLGRRFQVAVGYKF